MFFMLKYRAVDRKVPTQSMDTMSQKTNFVCRVFLGKGDMGDSKAWGVLG